MTETIALFGATGGSGSEVLSAALEKGYKVRIMVRTPSKVTVSEHPNLTIFKGDFTSTKAIQDTVKGADYVISCVGGPVGKPKDFPVGEILAFIKDLFGIMKDTPSVKVFLHQSGAFIPHPDGTQPFSMKVVNKVVGQWIAGIGPNMIENENIMKYMDSIQGQVKFKTIATRPGALMKGEGGKKLIARAGPPMGLTTYKDLGVFTVDAIHDETLYGKFPYVGEQESSGMGYTTTATIAAVAIVAGLLVYRRN
jgi:hypothetical protein